MQYSSGEVVEIGDIVTYLDPLGRVDENGEIVHDTLTLRVNQVCNDRYLVLGSDEGRRYGVWDAKGLTLKEKEK